MIIFDVPEPDNTPEIVSVVKKEASRCDYIVIASITGSSALQVAAAALKKTNCLCHLPTGNILGG